MRKNYIFLALKYPEKFGQGKTKTGHFGKTEKDEKKKNMKKNPKFYPPKFKAKVVKEFIKGDKTQAEICSQYQITTKTFQRWYQE